MKSCFVFTFYYFEIVKCKMHEWIIEIKSRQANGMNAGAYWLLFRFARPRCFTVTRSGEAQVIDRRRTPETLAGWRDARVADGHNTHMTRDWQVKRCFKVYQSSKNAMCRCRERTKGTCKFNDILGHSGYYINCISVLKNA